MWHTIFGWPKDVSEQASKKGFYDFVSAFFFITLLAKSSPNDLGIALSRSVFPDGYLLKEKVSLAVLVSIVVSFLFNYFDVAAKLTKLMRIRERFEAKHIIAPLIAGLGPSNSEIREEGKSNLMRAFYRALDDERGSATKHLVWKSHNLWCWRYIALDHALMGIVTFAISASYNGKYWAVGTLCWSAFVGMSYFNGRLCAHVTRRQVKELLSDDEAKEALRKAVTHTNSEVAVLRQST